MKQTILRHTIRYTVAVMLLLVAVGARAETTYQSVDSICIANMLSAARQQPRTTCFPLYFARQFLDRPYVSYTLEVTTDGVERLEVNTRQLDCTTLVETVTALTLCVYHCRFTWRDYVNHLMSLRYRNGRLNGYTSRLHYFSDWIRDNSRRENVIEIQQDEPPFNAIQQLDIHYMTSHPKAYRALRNEPELLPVIRQQEDSLTGLRYRYIPKADVKDTPEMRRAIRDGDIIAITCSKPGLDIAHLGFAVWQSDGLHLLNASQLHKRVVIEPMTLGQYLSKHPSHTGIRVIRIVK
jgi:hypothetical protein